MIREYVIDNFLFGEEEQLKSDTSFIQEGIIDSIGMMELVDFIETKFDIKIQDNELIPENLDSLTNLSSFLQQKMES